MKIANVDNKRCSYFSNGL